MKNGMMYIIIESRKFIGIADLLSHIMQDCQQWDKQNFPDLSVQILFFDINTYILQVFLQSSEMHIPIRANQKYTSSKFWSFGNQFLTVSSQPVVKLS